MSDSDWLTFGGWNQPPAACCNVGMFSRENFVWSLFNIETSLCLQDGVLFFSLFCVRYTLRHHLALFKEDVVFPSGSPLRLHQTKMWYTSKYGSFFCENYWLVVWNMNFIFPYIENNHPKWLIFFRGVETTNQIMINQFILYFFAQHFQTKSHDVCTFHAHFLVRFGGPNR